MNPCPPPFAYPSIGVQQSIVWVVAEEERIGFETNRASDAQLMYEAFCILLDRCNS